MANKNSTSLPIIFKLPFSWFSVCLSFVNIWLFSRVLTVYSDNIACVFFFFFFWCYCGKAVSWSNLLLCVHWYHSNNRLYWSNLYATGFCHLWSTWVVIFKTIKPRFYIFTIYTVSSIYCMMHNSLHYQYKPSFH